MCDTLINHTPKLNVQEGFYLGTYFEGVIISGSSQFKLEK